MNRAGKALARLYSEHHRDGGRLKRSWREEDRAALFTTWLGQGRRVLDLGCRDGTLTRHFREGNQVVGGDVDPEALEAAARDYGLETRQLDLNADLPFSDGDFDAVVLAETLEHLPYPTLTLGEIRRVLAPGGLFLGNVPLEYHFTNRWRVLFGKEFTFDPTHLQHFSYNSLCALLGRFFQVDLVVPLASERIGPLSLARFSLNLFAKNVAFRCRKTEGPAGGVGGS
ncbi:MAG: class I SAM-dependent methyltransferase [Thermodesulfobacteriota bacterium]